MLTHAVAVLGAVHFVGGVRLGVEHLLSRMPGCARCNGMQNGATLT